MTTPFPLPSLAEFTGARFRRFMNDPEVWRHGPYGACAHRQAMILGRVGPVPIERKTVEEALALPDHAEVRILEGMVINQDGYRGELNVIARQWLATDRVRQEQDSLRALVKVNGEDGGDPFTPVDPCERVRSRL